MDNIISCYTQEQAIEDGILVKVGSCGKLPVIFTTNLFNDGYEDEIKCVALVNQGLQVLRLPDKEDTSYMRLRVIEKGKIWVIANAESITFLKPEDY